MPRVGVGVKEMTYNSTPDYELSISQENSNVQSVLDNLPMNKRRYKYNLCKIIDENTDKVDSCEFVDNVHMSPFDRPSNLYFTDSLDSLKSLKNNLYKGWASGRSNICLREGLTYFEFQIKHIDWSKNCNTRVGISQRCFPLGQPVGSDLQSSIGIRDMSFERLFNRKRDSFINSSTDKNCMHTGDSIGFLVNLPNLENQYKQIELFVNDLISKETDEFELFHLNRYLKDLNETYIKEKGIIKERILIRYKNETYYESQDYIKNEVLKESQSLELEGSFVKIFQNGNYRGDLIGSDDKFLPNFLPPFTLVNYETLRYKQIFSKFKKMNDWHTINTLIPRKYYDDGSLGYYPTISLFNDAVLELNGTISDMKYYDSVSEYVLGDISIENKRVKTLEDVYEELKERERDYDNLAFQKKKQDLDVLTAKQNENLVENSEQTSC